MISMRTTVDIPEGLLRRVRARAALDGRKMKDVVNEALRRHLGVTGGGEDRQLSGRVEVERAGRFLVPVVRSSRPDGAAIAPERLRELEMEEDERRHGEVFGR